MSSVNFTILELLNSRELIGKIAEAKCGDGVFKFHLATIVTAINTELAKFDTIKGELFTKLGSPNLETNIIEIKEEHKEEFTTEMSKLLTLNVELNFSPLDPVFLNCLNFEIEDYLKLLKFLQK